MKKKSGAVSLVAALAGIALTATAGPGTSEKIFTGEIADSQCALNVHSLSQSHKEMMGIKPEIKTDTECVRFDFRLDSHHFLVGLAQRMHIQCTLRIGNFAGEDFFACPRSGGGR